MRWLDDFAVDVNHKGFSPGKWSCLVFNHPVFFPVYYSPAAPYVIFVSFVPINILASFPILIVKT